MLMKVQHKPRYWVFRGVQGLLGESGWEMLAMRRREFYWRRTGIVFIHVPKVAGSSLSTALYGRRLGHVRYYNIQTYAKRALETAPVFSVIRNPASRLISAYRYVKAIGTAEGGLYDRPIYHSAYFETFESFLFDWLPNVNLFEEDFVFQPQTSFLENNHGEVEDSIRLFTLEYGIGALSLFLARFTHSEIERRNVNNKSSDVVSLAKCMRSAEARRVMQRCYGRDEALFERTIAEGHKCEDNR